MFVFEKGKGRADEEDEGVEGGGGAPANFAYTQRSLKLRSQGDADDSMDEFVLL